MLQDPAIRVPIAISLGAIGGALCRYYLTIWSVHRFGISFPYGVFFINLSGCLLMGFLATVFAEQSTFPEVRLMLTTGFLGAYTTFSTYGLDTLNLLKTQNFSAASFYWLGSAVLGVAFVQLGAMLARIGK